MIAAEAFARIVLELALVAGFAWGALHVVEWSGRRHATAAFDAHVDEALTVVGEPADELAARRTARQGTR